MKNWESIADKLGKAGWSWRGVSTVDSDGGTIFVANAHRDSGKRSLNVRMLMRRVEQIDPGLRLYGSRLEAAGISA